MAVPKKKISKSKRNMRRAHDRLPEANWVEDQETGEAKRRHHIDLKSGTYRGRRAHRRRT